MATGNLVATLTGHGDAVLDVSFSPDGSRIASGSRDYTVKVWDVATGNVVASVAGRVGYVNSVAFSPDGSRIASGGGGKTVKVWDVAEIMTRASANNNGGAACISLVSGFYENDLIWYKPAWVWGQTWFLVSPWVWGHVGLGSDLVFGFSACEKPKNKSDSKTVTPRLITDPRKEASDW